MLHRRSAFFGVVLFLLVFGVAWANPLAWFESELAKGDLRPCPSWAADADACGPAGGTLGGSKFLALNRPPAGYEFGGADYHDWVEFPRRCYSGTNELWPRGCRIAMELRGPTQPVIVVRDRVVAFYLNNPGLVDEIAVARGRMSEEQAAREQANRERLEAERHAAVGSLSTRAKVETFARALFESMNVGVRSCPASQASFSFALCGQTHGDAEVFRLTTDLFLQSSNKFDGEIVTEWLGSSQVPYRGVRIDGVLVTITFEGSLGPYGNFGRAYVNANF